MHHDSKDEFFGNGDAAYRRLAELLQDAVVLQSGGNIVYTNISGARLLGATSPGVIVGRLVLDFVHSDSRELVKERIELLEEKESVVPARRAGDRGRGNGRSDHLHGPFRDAVRPRG